MFNLLERAWAYGRASPNGGPSCPAPSRWPDHSEPLLTLFITPVCCCVWVTMREAGFELGGASGRLDVVSVVQRRGGAGSSVHEP